MNTLVIQSHRTPLPYAWIEPCLESVRGWCELNAYDYHFAGDELFDPVPESILDKTRHQPVIASDLARLLVMRQALENDYARLVWLDADFLIFQPDDFVLPETAYAVGREVWVQHDGQGRLRAYKKIHNAFLMFCRGNAFLDFYIDTAIRLLLQNTGTVPPQFIGPKLLTALHNVAMLPVMETAGMLSPMVINDVLKGEGEALAMFNAGSPQPIAGANLCISSCEQGALKAGDVELLIELLLAPAAANYWQGSK